MPRIIPMTFRVLFGSAVAIYSAVSVSAAPVFRVNLSSEPKEISPLIYGLNDWARNEVTGSIGYTLERQGGNRMSGYNWENNFSNAGNDYIHHSDRGLSNTAPEEERDDPGRAVTLSVDHARGAGRPSLVTLQLAGYVAADGNGTVSESEVAPSARWKEVKVWKEGAYSLNPDTSDAFVYMDEQVNFLLETYGSAAEGGVFAYSLDNEPALWGSTHSRMHPEQPGAEEIISKGAETAAMVKSLDADALVFGPALYGWGAYEDFQDAPDWGNYSGTYDWFIDAYLGEMKALSEEAEVRLLDVLDIHYYPEVGVVMGKNEDGSDDFTRITDSVSNNEDLTQARLQAPRSLWDPEYVEESWVTQWSTGGQPLKVFPRVFASIEAQYPGTKLGITEYDFGGHQNYSGGLAQVDVLGIYGRDGVYAACFWGEVEGFVVPAFQLYRNYDGEGAGFGDISLGVENPDKEQFSSYASLNSETGSLHVIVVNKGAAVEAATIQASGIGGGIQSVVSYGFSEETGEELQEMDTLVSESVESIQVDLPARSAMHFVFTLASGGSLVRESRIERSEAAGDAFLLKAFGAFGHRYQLERSLDLVTWTDVGAAVIGLGQDLEISMKAEASRQFWRLAPVE